MKIPAAVQYSEWNFICLLVENIWIKAVCPRARCLHCRVVHSSQITSLAQRNTINAGSNLSQLNLHQFQASNLQQVILSTSVITYRLVELWRFHYLANINFVICMWTEDTEWAKFNWEFRINIMYYTNIYLKALKQ